MKRVKEIYKTMTISTDMLISIRGISISFMETTVRLSK